MKDGTVQRLNLPGGAILAVRKAGRGPIPIMFLHGYSLSTALWERVIARLPGRFSSYSYDLRGFEQPGHPGRYEYRDHVEDLRELLDGIGADRAVFVGHSLGGSILPLFGTLYPERLLALILSNTRPANLPPPDSRAGGVEERIEGYGTPEGARRVLEPQMARYFDAANLAPGELAAFVGRALTADQAALAQTLMVMYGVRVVPTSRSRPH